MNDQIFIKAFQLLAVSPVEFAKNSIGGLLIHTSERTTVQVQDYEGQLHVSMYIDEMLVRIPSYIKKVYIEYFKDHYKDFVEKEEKDILEELENLAYYNEHDINAGPLLKFEDYV